MNMLLSIRRICLAPRVLGQWVIDRIYGPALLRARGVRHSRGLRLHGLPVISLAPGAQIILGTDVSLRSRASSNPLYLARPCTLAACSAGAVIEVGDGAAFSAATLVACSGIYVGQRTLIGAEAMLLDSDFHPLDPQQRRMHPTEGAATRPIRLGNDVFVGARALILKGVTIGDGAVIGAGAIVHKDVAPGDIVAGNPARVIGNIFSKKASQEQVP